MDSIEDIIKFNQESGTLDFKQIEYIDGIGNGELVKDVLAFANSHIPGNKIIIIGIKKDKEEYEVFDILKPQDSANIQSLISANIEPEIIIEYTPYRFEGKNIMVLTIINPIDRPYLLKKDIQKKDKTLFHKASTMLIRKGTTTQLVTRSDLDKIYDKTNKPNFVNQIKLNFAHTKTQDINLNTIQGLQLPSNNEKEKIEKIIYLSEQLLKESPKDYMRIVENSRGQRMESTSQRLPLPELRSRLEHVETTFMPVDNYYLGEITSHKLQFIIENLGNEPLINSIIIFKFPQIVGLHIMRNLVRIYTPYSEFNRTYPPTPDELNYPSVTINTDEYEVVSNVGNIKHQIITEAFLTPLRIYFDEELVNSQILFTATLYADNLILPAQFKFKINVI